MEIVVGLFGVVAGWSLRYYFYERRELMWRRRAASRIVREAYDQYHLIVGVYHPDDPAKKAHE